MFELRSRRQDQIGVIDVKTLEIVKKIPTESKPDGSAYKAGDVYYLYTPNLDHLSNDAENFGGLMTEIHITT